MQKARERAKLPRYLQAAQSLYGPAFEVRGPEDMRDALADWSSLSVEQRAYATAHLLYLNLQAQAVTQRLLAEVRDNSDDLAEDTDTLARAARDRFRDRDVEASGQTPTGDEAPKRSPVAAAAEAPKRAELGNDRSSASDADAPVPESLALDDDEPSTLAELFNQSKETSHEHR